LAIRTIRAADAKVIAGSVPIWQNIDIARFCLWRCCRGL